MTPKNEIAGLVSDLIEHNYNYYILDKPTISDAEYDTRYNRLKELERLHPQFIQKDSPTQNVGHPIVASQFSLMAHRFPMLSLDNSLTVDALIDWTIDISGDVKEVMAGKHEVRIEWKMDGLSLDLVYYKGRLLYAITRGDGHVGEIVTLNALQIESIPKTIDPRGVDWISIRGEVVANLAHYRKLNAELEAAGKKAYANPRNYAAGSLRQKDPAVTAERGLEFYAYSYTPHDSNAVHHWNQEQDILTVDGFKTADVSAWDKEAYFDFSSASGQHTNIPVVVNRLQALRSQLPFEVDGLVIKVMDHEVRDHLGYTSKFPRWATAYKFPATEGYTELLDVEYQIGRTGQATPVARIFPVTVHGTTISNVTLHNRTQIERLKLYKGCQVIVRRAGDVIPQIVGTVSPRLNQDLYEPLSECPCCGHKTYVVKGKDGEQDFCSNRMCKDRLLAHLNYCTERKVLNIKGLGPSVIQALFEDDICHKYHGLALLDLTVMDFIRAGQSEHQAQKLFEAVAKARSELTLERAIMALGIDGVAEGGSERLARHFQTMRKLADSTVEELVTIDDVGSITAQSIFEFFDAERPTESQGCWMPYIGNLNLPAPAPKVVDSAWDGVSVVVTGSKFGNFKRKYVEDYYKQLGATIAKDVSSTTKMVLCGTKYTTRKLESAKANNIDYAIYDESGLVESKLENEINLNTVIV